MTSCVRYLKRAGPLPDLAHDPGRRLLCAVVLQALRDATAARVDAEIRAEAWAFLASEVGRELVAELIGVDEERVRTRLGQIVDSF